LRVIAGEFRSRLLKSVPGREVRPTPDRLREALFNVLAPKIPGTTFLDAYAGSGAVAIEALSRGAKRAVLIERSARAIGIIRENLKALGISSRALVVRASAGAALLDYPADVAFIDPPYDAVDEYERALTAIAKTNCTLTVVQHARRLKLDDNYEGLKRARVLRQGDNVLSFFERG
jgi:16S rRNA (guanine966-N2)-methyltransferase